VKDENGDLSADSHSIFNRWKNYFSQQFIARRFSDVRQMGVPTAESLVHEPSLPKDTLMLHIRKAINRQVLIEFRQK
jgi:hypothetical protein